MFSSWIGSKRNNPTGSSCFFWSCQPVSSYWGGQPQAFKYFCHSLMASCVGLPNNAAKCLVGNGLTGWIGVPALDLSPSRPLDLSTSRPLDLSTSRPLPSIPCLMRPWRGRRATHPRLLRYGQYSLLPGKSLLLLWEKRRAEVVLLLWRKVVLLLLLNMTGLRFSSAERVNKKYYLDYLIRWDCFCVVGENKKSLVSTKNLALLMFDENHLGCCY